MPNTRVFLDFAIDGAPIGRVIFELFNDTAPKTCENFRALCTGEKGLSSSGSPLYYKNSIVHRSIKGFMIQAGDFTKKNGSGGESIYGGPFPDEDLQRPLDSEGLLCMANKGPNTNGSQFFITLRDCPHLNGKHVVFGRVVRGYGDVVLKLVDIPVDSKDRPQQPIVIYNCGELELLRKNQDSQNASQDSEKKRSNRSKSPSSDSSNRRRKRPKKKDVVVDVDEGKNLKVTDPATETEAEYDARLEREERDRLEANRRKELERIKQQAAVASNETGVRLKGRGRMQFLDPELRR